jgi:hypothetical protein
MGKINEIFGKERCNPRWFSNSNIELLINPKYLKKNRGKITTIIPQINNLCFFISDFVSYIPLVNK